MKTKLFTLVLALTSSIGTMFAMSGTLIGNLYYYLKSNWTAQVTYQYMWDPTNYSGLEYLSIPISVRDNDGHYYYVTSVGESAFHDCTSMKEASMEFSRVSELNSFAFVDCSNLERVGLSDSLTFIGYAAFRGCESLRSIKIPAKTTYVGYEAFSGCSSLTKIVCKAITPPSCGDDTFQDVDKSIPLYVPVNSVETYKNTDYWNEFTNIYPFYYAEDVYNITEVTATPHENSVTIKWPFDWDAYFYIVEIKKNANVVYQLVFDGIISQYNGWQYTIEDLEEGTEYSCTVTAKKEDGTEAFSQTITFLTLSHEGIEDIQVDANSKSKILHEGQIYIRRGDKIYSIQGQEVK